MRYKKQQKQQKRDESDEEPPVRTKRPCAVSVVRKQKRKRNESSSENESDVDEENQAEEKEEHEEDDEVRYGPDFSKCEVGMIAVVKWVSPDNKAGISVMDVLKIDFERQKFTGCALMCKPNLTSPLCIKAKWWRPTTVSERRKNTSEEDFFSVLAYCKSLEKSSKKTSPCLPLDIRRLLSSDDSLFSART